MKKKILSVMLAVCMVLGLMPGLTQTAYAAGTVHTVAAWDDPLLGSGMPGVASGDTLVLPEVAAADTVLSVPAGITALTVQGRAVYTNLSIVLDTGHPGLTLTIQDLSMAASSGIDLSGASASSLLLAGSNTIGSRIVVPEGMTLTIDGSGSLTANAGIGGGHDYTENGGTVIIYGGSITAQGEEGTAGIGGGNGPARAGDVVIWDGTITATGGDDGSGGHGGAGIGCGYGTGNPGTVTIHGGTIVATGIDGGAGIGGGYGHGTGGVVTINGGDITTTGGDDGADNYGGAGIGSGSNSGTFTVAINGGTIRAYGGANAAGIGAGRGSQAVDIAITDATVIAVGGSGIGEHDGTPLSSGGAGIGGAAVSGNGSCSISNSTVTVQGGDGSAGIGSGFKSGGMALTVTGSTITATGGENGAGIGSGIWGGGVDLAVSSGRITATGGTNAQDIGASLLVLDGGDLHGASGSLTVTGWVLITADDTISPTGSNGPYTINLFTAPGVHAGAQTVTVAADDSSFSFTQDTDSGGTLGGIYLAPDTDVLISVAGYDVKTATDTGFGSSVAFNSGSTAVALDIYLSAASANGWTDLSANIPMTGLTDLNITDMSFISDNEGWLTAHCYDGTGYVGRIYHTDDGGATFEVAKDLGSTILPNAIHMVSSTEGWMGSQNNRIYYTSDGGANWTSLGTTGNPVRDITVPQGSSTGYSVGDNGTAFSFTSTAITSLPTGISSNLRSVSFVSAAEGWLCGGAINRHFTGGVWTADQTYPTNGYNSISMTSSTHGCAVGDNGIIITTSDGQNWTERTNPDTGNHGLNKNYFLNSNKGWAVGDSGTILHTTDGGVNWQVQVSGTSSPLRAVQFTSSTNGYAAGNDGTFLKFTSTGSTATAPTVVTNAASNLNISSATLNGNVTSDGGATVTARGFVYGLAANPAIGGSGVTQVAAGSGTGVFTSTVSGLLSASTTYHVRAYATNSEGTAYGEDRTFTTLAAIVYVDTEEGGEVVIGAEAAWSGAPTNIKGALFWNGSAWISNNTAAHMYFTDLLDVRILNYADVAIPAAAGTSTQNGVGFIAEEYSYQVAAADGSGTYQYTGMKYTITQADGKKIILLSRGLGRGTGAAYLEAFIENPTSGTLAIRDGSVLYSHTGTAAEAAALISPTTGVMGLLRTADVYWLDISGGSDMGGFTYSPHTEALSGTLVAAAHPAVTNQMVRFDLMLMSESVLYRYMLSPSITSETFVPTTIPTVATNAASGVIASGATLNGNVTSDGGATVTARGFVYGSAADPAIGGSGVTQAAAGTGTGVFTTNISGLAASTTYHVRAYATNSEGTTYGEDRTFTTQSGGGGDPSPVAPTVVTNDTSGITASGATLNGNVTASGDATVTERGFVYGAAANPAIGGAGVTKVIIGSGTGSFNTAITGLAASTFYHVRAYAINSVGTSYGADKSFTTLAGTTPTTPPDDNDPDYIPRTLTDNVTGITVSGSLVHRSAALTVQNMALHAEGTCAACDAIRQRMADDDFLMLIGKDISLSYGFQGSLTITIPVGSTYNGDTVTILHCANGTLQTFTATVKDGKATFAVTSLSPFAVFTATDVLDNIPKTGDGGGFPLGLGLSALGVLGFCLLVLTRKRRRA